MTRALVLTVAVACTACAAAPPARVEFGAGFPQAAPDWPGALERWTRRGGFSQDWTRMLDAAATLESPEWRAAYARERARRLHMGPDAAADLLAAQTAAAGGPIEVELIVATAKPEWNDFRKGKDSMWRLALATADGREVLPLSVREDRRPRVEIASWFPDLKPFYSAYVVTFPRATADGRAILAPESRQVSLKIGAALGAIELHWADSRPGSTNLPAARARPSPP